jgi:hypothetical protein
MKIAVEGWWRCRWLCGEGDGFDGGHGDAESISLQVYTVFLPYEVLETQSFIVSNNDSLP